MSEDNDKEFIAFSKKLLRELTLLKIYIEQNNEEDALCLVNGLIEDTEGDIAD